MSGPKTSSYELERQRRMRLEEEARQRRLAAEAELRRRREEERKKKERIEAEIRKKTDVIDAKSREYDAMLSSINQVIEQEQQRLREEEKRRTEAKVEQVAERERVLDEADVPKTLDIQDLLAQVRRDVHVPAEHEDSLEEIVLELQQGPMEMRSLLDVYIPKVAPSPDTDGPVEPTEEEKFDELLLQMESEYQEILQDRAFFKQDRERIIRFEEICKRQQEYRSYEILRDVYYGEFSKIKKARNEWHRLYDQWKGTFDEAYTKYCAACQLLGKVPMYYYLKVQSAEADIKNLEAEAERLHQEYLEQQESIVITEAFNEVMKELGYQVLGTKEITKKSGGKVKNTVFSYGEGSGIHVIDNGESITMEVVGIEDEKRAITEEEKEYLEAEQEGFCESYVAIHEALKKRGVVLKKRIRMLPASKEFSTLMDMSGYTLTEERQKKKSISKVEKKRTRKQQNKKYIDK